MNGRNKDEMPLLIFSELAVSRGWCITNLLPLLYPVKKGTCVVTVALHFVLTAQDCQELAELVHKVHLLCRLARVGVVDMACNGPLIQASVLCFTTRLAVEWCRHSETG
ncbi:uncharacterized protein LOC124691856 [Lolium rigidum]|uniref:uncharacterized protein LOC124691856 n=1 Tax=Lolium rigidum TaxID=89674 RepID=UPI001F5C518F|nr:uncharacterized protein LOC124691856 [Lolium rigidum]